MKIYCYTCGTGNEYIYSKGKPHSCGFCGARLAEASKPVTVVNGPNPTSSANSSGFKWVREIKLNELFDITVTVDE